MNQYDGTCDMKKVCELTGKSEEDFKLFNIELVLGTFEDAEKWCGILREEVMELMPNFVLNKLKLSDMFKPKFHVLEGKIICGFQIPLNARAFGGGGRGN